MTEKFKIKLPLTVYCWHPNPEDEEEGGDLVKMKIEESDPQVPSYMAKCPKCGHEVIFDFSPVPLFRLW